MKAARLTTWERVEGLGLLGGFILLVVADVADAEALGWAARAVLILAAAVTALLLVELAVKRISSRR